MHQETVVTGGLVEGPWLARMRPTIERVAASDLPVLILGETGCGKEMIADIVHRMSARADRPLLRINSCITRLPAMFP